MDVESPSPDHPAEFDFGFSVSWQEPAGQKTRPLREAAEERFESAVPVRRFNSYPGQRHFPGWYWSATTGTHVPFESWLERDHALLLDFDRQVIGFAAQPFWLSWRDQVTGTKRSHAPDFFARARDGRGMVVDCRPLDRIDAQAERSFAAMRAACELVGWSYRVAGAIEATRVSNLRWLAGYRHPRYCISAALSARVTAAFTSPGPLLAQAATAGDPLMVLPVVFHLMWQGILTVDLSLPLTDFTVVFGGWRSA